jgi:dipeptidyl aminopeptidase/acylaminoacyl peptidase
MTAPASYGSWPSPVSAADVAGASTRFDGARFVGDEVWWAQSVPEEGGRMAVRRRRGDGRTEDVLPAPWSARSRVHEYGGGAWCATEDGLLLFVAGTDQRVYALGSDGAPTPLTPEEGDTAFGGLVWAAGRLLAVRERTAASGGERAIVEIALDGSGARVVAAGDDFVAQPALSPDGRHLAWIGWNHPDLPWDRTRLRVGRLRDGVVTDAISLTDGSTSALQPVWAGSDELLYLDDASGRWQVQRVRPGTGEKSPITHDDADTGGALWTLGMRWFAPLEDGRIVAVRTNGEDSVVVIDPADGTSRSVGVDGASQTFLEDTRGTRLLITTASASAPLGLWLVDADGTVAPERLAGDDLSALEPWLPTPRAITTDGAHGPVHAYFYPPTHPELLGPEDELAPCLVWVHGGPTAHVGPAASRKIAFFTSRGIGILDVNYSGSTGYGRAYRERLRGQWGVADVDDVIAAARYVAEAGLADPDRLAIEGGSAGGWTVLSALARGDVFAAGVSRYGVGDARALVADTHDFESRYLDGLIGPLPETEDVYIERSPLTHPERFRVPLLILQGTEDRVVPPAQAEAIQDALRRHGVPHAYVLYEGEGHGFRRRETTIDALTSELAFLGQVFGFVPDAPELPLSVGALRVADGPDGREVFIDAEGDAEHAERDLRVVVSREPLRPLFARPRTPEWTETLRRAGFTATAGDQELFVLLPALDGE